MRQKHHQKQMYELCQSHIHSYVLAETVDGSKIDGIITGLDEENVYLAVPMSHEAREETSHASMDRQFGYHFGHGPGFGFGHPGFFPPRRFRRLIIPLAALAALSILPWY